VSEVIDGDGYRCGVRVGGRGGGGGVWSGMVGVCEWRLGSGTEEGEVEACIRTSRCSDSLVPDVCD